jgi:uncharacterized membrane protein
LGVRIGKPIILKWFAVVVVVIATITGAFYVTSHKDNVKAQLASALTRQPERFTELYFAEPSKIPNKATAGQKFPVSFAIHNLEGRDMSYAYVITFTDDKVMATTLADNTVIISDGQLQTLTHDVGVPEGTGRGQLTVQLTNPGQAVRFWLERT